MKNIKIISLIIGMLIVLLCESFYKKPIRESVSFSRSFDIDKLTDQEYLIPMTIREKAIVHFMSII